MSVEQGSSEPADDGGSDVFEIVLPITVFVLSDDDFLQDDAEEQAAPLPKEEEQEINLNSNTFLTSSVTLSNAGNNLSIWEEDKTAANQDSSMKYCEEKCIAERVCNSSKSPSSGCCGAGTDKCSQNYMLPGLSYEIALTELSETSDRKECDGDDSFQKIPPLLSSAGSEGRAEATTPSRQLTSAVISRHEEELISVLSAGGREKQPEIHKETETVVEIKDSDSSKNGADEANNRTRKNSEFEDETLSSVLEHGLKDEPEFTHNCSALFLNGCSPTSEELLKDIGKPEMDTSTTAESNTTGEHIDKTLMPFLKEGCRQHKAVSPYPSPDEFQSQQEDLAWLNSSVTTKPLSKASCSIKKHGGLIYKCRFCSSVYKCSVHLKKHVYSAHKDKKRHKCWFCKRTFFFSVNLKNHLQFHKKKNRLQKSRKNRRNVRKVRQRISEERKSETKKKESKYEKFFSKIERDFTPVDVPVSFSCKICIFVSSHPKIFIHHLKGHNERPPYQCPQCDYSCISLSYLLNHMYWHAGYKLYQCRFCTFFSLYFSSMVRHSYVHAGAKPYSCESCQSAFTSDAGLKKHRKLHAGKETCQGQQLGLESGRKRTRRPLKNYTCDECNVVFYTREHLCFHKKFHEQFKATANGYTNHSNEYHKSKIRKGGSASLDCVALSPSGKENDFLSRGVLAAEVGFERAGNVRVNKNKCSGKKLPENSHGSNSLRVIGDRSEVPLNSYKKATVIYKEEPLFSQVQDGDVYPRFVGNLKDSWPPNLSMFKTYKCQRCNYTTAVHSEFKLHLKIHTDERPFVCKECNKTFKTSSHLQKHSLIHLTSGYKFGHCFYVNRHLEALELQHETCGGLAPEKTSGSSEGSSRVRSLLGSEAFGVQPGVQRGKENDLGTQRHPQFYQCTECEYATCALSNLQLHVRTHTGEKPYSCSICQKKFRTSSHLKRHSITHFNMEFHKCRMCDYATNKWLSLKRHLASHSCGESSSTSCLYEQKQLPVKTYTCEECGYSTAHNGNLKPHLRIHTGEKPFKCSQCAVAFRTSSHLKRHLLTHLKLHCRRCKFSTLDKCAFQKHIKTHSKKFKCEKCNVMLPTKTLLEKHNRQHKLGI
ncbi:uncharacterized protein O3Q21_008196 isoform 2-T2 [Podargus strigoides]